MSEVPDFVREMWAEVRPGVIARTDGVVALAREWAATGDADAWQSLLREAHQLAGALGSYGQADAGAAAVALDSCVRSAAPDPQAVVEAAVRLRECLGAP